MAEGFTNRQIADHLFITVNTAGVHVSHILTKMDAENRVTAAGIAHRLRLVDTPQTLTQGGSSGKEEEEADEHVRRARHV